MARSSCTGEAEPLQNFQAFEIRITIAQMIETRSRWLSQTPLVPTGGTIAESIAFYTQQLGFTVDWEGGNMAGIRRDDVCFNLVESTNKEWIANSSISIGVTDLDAFYQEIKSIKGKISPPTLRPWGRRELHIILPSGVCLQFYQQNG